MSKALSLKMDEDIFKETEKIVHQMKLPRNAYINKAVASYNRLYKKYALKRQFAKEVELLRHDTRDFLDEFNHLDTEIFE